jgi:endoglucanase
VFTRDFIQLREAGFDNVRLPFDPEYYGFTLDGIHGPRTMNFLSLDRAIGLALQNGLYAVLDIDPNPQFMMKLQNHPEYERQFIALWAAIATRYKSRPADMLAYELLNEPQYFNQEKHYADFVRRLVAAIRSVDKAHLVIVGAPHNSSIEGLFRIEPLADPNIAYDFHDSYAFPHKGIHNGPLKDNTEQFVNRIKIAAQWAKTNRAWIFCGEFGVPRGRTDPDLRYRRIADIRRALEINGIGWELWDYTDTYGITMLHGKTSVDPDGTLKFINPDRGSRIIETQAYSALGLK